MKKLQKTILALSALALTSSLFACNGESSKGVISLDAAAELLKTLSDLEAEEASSVFYKTTETKNDDVTETEETFTIGDDYSSKSEGTISKKNKGVLSKSDTFIRRRLKKTDTIINGSSNQQYERFYAITDYKDNNVVSSDEASALFLFDTEEEASAASVGDYMLNEYFTVMAGAHAIATLHDNFVAQVINIPSLSAQTDAYFNFSGDGSRTTYSYHGAYEEDGDMNDTVVYTVDISFVVENDKLTSYSFVNGMVDELNNASDDSSSYKKESKIEATLTYGTRGAIDSDISVDSYFLSSVSEVQLYSSGKPGSGYEINDPNKISEMNNYISASAKAYAPTTAVDLTLTPYKSSMQSVVKLNGEYFEIVAPGTTSLTFYYLGQDGANQYAFKSVKVPVTITGALPERIVVAESSNYYDDENLYLGQTYTFSVSTYPSKADQSFEYTVSNEEALKVTRSDNKLTLAPQKEASDVILTIYSSIDDTIKATYTFQILEDPTEENKAYLISHKFDAYKRLVQDEERPMEYGYVYQDLTFNDDDSGSVVIISATEDGTPITDGTEKKTVITFTYKVSLTKITFVTFNGEKGRGADFETGQIKNNGPRLEIDDANYKTLLFLAK